MGKIEAETCSVCKENSSKYRCPRCGAPYCSLVCNKAHKAGSGPAPPCTGKRAGAPSSTPSPNSGGGGDNRHSPAGVKRPREEEVANENGGVAVEGSTKACVRKGRDQWRGGREDKEEEEWQMSADQMERISGCAWLKAAVRDPKLQKLLVS